MNYLVTLLNHMIENKKTVSCAERRTSDQSDPSNYRGITVTPVVLKILEHVLNQRYNQILHKTQSKRQRCTSRSSSMGAAMILSECINEAQNKKEDLFFATLDVQKAFDVVDPDILLRKLYLDGIRGNDWMPLRDLYTDMMSSVKWEGHLFSPFIQKWNRKFVRTSRRFLLTSHYKRYNNPLLIQIEDRYT